MCAANRQRLPLLEARMNLITYVQNLFDRFAGELGVFIAGVVIAKGKDGYSWFRNRYRPDPRFTSLVTSILRGNLRMRSASDGELTLTIQFVNLSGNELILTHCQLNYWQFNNTSMPTPTSSFMTPRLVIAPHGIAHASVCLRLNRSELADMYRVSKVAPNTRSTPGNKVRVGFLAVAKRRFTTTTLEMRHLDSEELDILLPDAPAEAAP